MVKHNGPTCRGCGAPLRPGDEITSGLCDACYDWNSNTAWMSGAIAYASKLQQQEQQQAWVARKRERRGRG